MLMDPRLQEGVRLFNQGKFFECHEVIESLWLEVRDANRDFYKGIIQAAAAFHHLRRGNLSGAEELLKTSLHHLNQYPSETLGLNVHQLTADIKDCLTSLKKRKADEKSFSPELLFPTLDFRIDSC